LGNTAIIPTSYDLLAYYDGRNHAAVLSGLLIGGGYLTNAGASVLGWWMLRTWPLAFGRKTVSCLCVAVGAYVLLLAVAAIPSFTMSSQGHVMALFSAKLLLGFHAGLTTIITRTAAQTITPAEEQVTYNIIHSTTNALGLGLGPLFSTFVGWSLGSTSVGEATAYPLFVISLAFMILACFTYAALPDDPAEMFGEERSSVDALPARDEEAHPAAFSASRNIFIFGIMLSGERALLVAALEAATALFFESEFKFLPDEIGLAVSTAFVSGVPIMLTMMVIRRRQLVPGGTTSGFLLNRKPLVVPLVASYSIGNY